MKRRLAIMLANGACRSESENESQLSKEENSQIEISSAEESEDEQPKTKPYLALLQSLGASSVPRPKRRKLNPQDVSAELGALESKTTLAASPVAAEDADTSDGEGDEESILAEDEGNDEEIHINLLTEADEELEGDNSDPFEAHFSNPDMAIVEKKIKAVEAVEWQTTRSVTKGSKITTMNPKDGDSETPPSFPSISSLDAVKLKQRLKEPAKQEIPDLDAVQREVAPMLFNYQDLFYCQRTVKNSDSIRRLVCLHALNHVFK
jgi:U3 small nucleolar RNA-associated protein 25